MPLARHVGTASLAGIVAGILVGGLLGRVVMRISGFMAGVVVLLVPAIVRWRGLPAPIGYASLIAILLLGAARTLTGVLQLLTGT